MKNRIHALNSVKMLIGNTPMLEVNFLYKNKKRRIFAKAESFNMTGSIKDRMALHIITKAIENCELNPGIGIFEATSGNTGISFAAIGKALGHPVNIFMPDWMSEERKNIIRSFGADIRLVSKEEGGFLGSIAMADEAAMKSGGFLPHQFSNCNNPEAHYLSTGPEISKQLYDLGIQADAFVAGVGTGGTVMGVGRFLKEQNPSVKIHPLEPANSPTLTTGHKVGKHRIQGISDEFIPEVCELNRLDDIICVDDGDAILMAQKLSSELGLGLGISSGANFLGAISAQEKLGHDASVVTIFCDSNKKYLSTDLMKTEPVKEGFLSSEIELIDFKVHQRAFSNFEMLSMAH